MYETGKPRKSKTLERHPLREWLLLAGFSLLLIAVIIGPRLWDAIRTDKSGLCIVVLVLFVVGMFKSAWDIRFIHQQFKLSNLQLTALETAPGIQAFLNSSISSVFRDHVSNLYEIYRRDNTINQDNLVSLLQNKMQSRTRFTEQTSTVIITLGLVGTIIGLIFAVEPLSAAFDPENMGKTEVLYGRMKLVMDNMKTAFYTTLFGAILGGIALRILSILVDSNSDNLVGHVAELCEVHLLPAMRHAAQDREIVPKDETPRDIDLRKYGLN
ncbi:MotA/TolQ/ExbB proton channel family protein [Bremerella cremea]